MTNFRLRVAAGVAAVLLGFLGVAAQSNAVPLSPAAAEADALWRSGKWEESAKAYDSLVRAEPENGQAWFRLGSALISLKKFADAIGPLEKAAALSNGPNTHFALAIAYAKVDKEKAFKSLERAASAGLTQLTRVQNDPDLSDLRVDPRFEQFALSVEKNARPCKFLQEAKQFDFWVGEWDVRVGGQSVGTNVIQRLEDGCLIMENWSSTGGSSGKSFNFFDPVSKKWRQTYVSNGQTVWEMTGEYRDGALRYEGEVRSSSGVVKTRVIFYDLANGTVHHTEDNSRDDGKTWTRVWDAIYIKKK